MTGKSFSGATTAPSRPTSRSTGEATLPAIRWVHPSPRGRWTPLTTPRLVIGRDSSCDVTLESGEVSRRHAEVVREGSAFVLRDLGSRNGTFVEGQRVEGAVLQPGTMLRLGEWIGFVAEATPSELREAPFGEIVAGTLGGPVLRDALDGIERVGASGVPVVIEGATGTGKEAVAAALHRTSGRTGPQLSINCGVLEGDGVAAALFGHARGAYTGADRARPGAFRAAHGGTLFLDEVLELPLQQQPKLLRALEAREVVPLGETTPVPVDVRIVSAAQRPMEDAVKDGSFRKDLWSRLETVCLRLPPLRARRDDIPPLLHHFLHDELGEHCPQLDARLVEAACVYDWPLNVRGLRSTAGALVALFGHEKVLTLEHLGRANSRVIAATDTDGGAHASSIASTPPELGRETLIELVRKHDGVVARAAAEAGISRQKAYRLLGSDLDAVRGEPT